MCSCVRENVGNVRGPRGVVFVNAMNNMPNASLDDLLRQATWVRQLAVALTADSSSADDLTQDAMLRLFDARPPAHGSTRPWLARVVRNLARSRWRADDRRKHRERVAARPERLPGTDELASEIEVHRMLANALAELDEPARSTIVLRYFHDRSSAEIARDEGVPEATVRSRLKRGLEALREKLDRRYGDRSAWLRALLPLAGHAVRATVASETAASITAVGTAVSWKLAALFVLLIGAGAALWLRSAHEGQLSSISTRESQAPRVAVSTSTAPATAEVEVSAPVDQRSKHVDRAPVVAATTASIRDEPEFVMTLHVVDQSHGPIHRADVEYAFTGRDDEFGPVPFTKLSVKDDGTCAIVLPRDVRSDEVHVHARADGFVPRSIGLGIAEKADVPLARPSKLSGTVLLADQRTPANGARVSARSDYGAYPASANVQEATTNAHGEYQLANVPIGSTTYLTVRLPQYSPVTEKLTPQTNDFQVQEISLQPGLRFGGRVIDHATGVAIGGAEIVLDGSTLGKSDIDGQFLVWLPATSDAHGVTMRFAARGYCVLATRVKKDDLATPMTAGLVRAMTVRGIVQDVAGSPVANAKVWSEGQNDKIAAKAKSPTELPPWMEGLADSSVIEGDYRQLSSITDAGGRFTCGGIVPTHKSITVHAARSGSGLGSAPVTLPAEPGAEQEAVIKLEDERTRGATIVGRLTFNGAPSRGTIRWRGPLRSGEVSANIRGDFEILDVDDGRIQLDPVPEPLRGFVERGDSGLAMRSWSFVCKKGSAAQADVDVVFPMATVSGRVHTAAGEGLAGYAVILDRNVSEGGQLIPVGGRGSSTTAADGSYQIKIPRTDGTYRLTVADQVTWKPHIREGVHPDDCDVDVVIAQSGECRMSFRGVSAVTHETVHPLDVWWRKSGDSEDAGSRIDFGSSDQDDRAVVAVPAGVYDVLARSDDKGYAPKLVLGVRVSKRSEPTKLDIEMDPGLEIEFKRATDSALLPADAAIFLIEDADAANVRITRDARGEASLTGSTWLRGPSIAARQLRFDEKGSWRVRCLRPGTYRWVSATPTVVVEPEVVLVATDQAGPISVRTLVR